MKVPDHTSFSRKLTPCENQSKTAAPTEPPTLPTARELPRKPTSYDATGKKSNWQSHRYFVMAIDYDELHAIAAALKVENCELRRSNAAHKITGNEIAELGKEWKQRAEKAEAELAELKARK